MKIFIDDSSENKNVFQLIDPTQFSEAEFEREVIKAFRCFFPNYFCGSFKGDFSFEGVTRTADVALIHKNWSHWFVVEVELTSHSLEGHVLPQIRCFRYGEPTDSCITSLCNGFIGFDRNRAESLLRFVPRSVAVVVNRYKHEWAMCLKGVDAQMITLSTFRESGGRIAYEIEGNLHVVQESLGFAIYSAIDRSFRMPLLSDIPRGRLQIEDPFGVLGTWIARESDESLWITKEIGDPALPHNEYLQILRTFDGRITLKLPVGR
jgi:hypothetical protein